jgi:hypothetical protein
MTLIRSYTDGQRGPSDTAAAQATGHGDFLNALQGAVRENPVAAALIGMGVLWMFTGGSNTSLFGGGGRKSIFSTVRQGTEEADRAVRDNATRVGSSIGDAANAASETATQATGVARQASAAVGERMSRTVGEAVDAAASAYDATTNTGARAAETISKATTSVADAIHETGTKWGNTVHHGIAEAFERQPLLLGAIGIAIGAGIAASIPTTDAENQAMGDASDFVRREVTEMAGQVKQMADGAAREAKAQGLTPEAAGEAVRAIGDKLSGVAQSAASIQDTSRGSKKG